MPTASSRLEHAYAKAAAGERLDAEEGRVLLEQGDLLTLGSLADAARQRKNPGRVVTYIVDRNVNYSNVCVTYCSFCAFYRTPGHEEGYVQTYEQIGERSPSSPPSADARCCCRAATTRTSRSSGTRGCSRTSGSTSPGSTSTGSARLRSPSSPRPGGWTARRSCAGFIAAGLGSIPGGGAEILVDRVRKQIAGRKATTDEWLDVMEDAHGLGLRSSATMMFGHVETLAERIEHLVRLREVQDRTGGFTAFICWTYQSPNTQLERKVPSMAGGHEYLKTLAVSRLVLDNFAHVQGSWVTQGPKIGQLSLSFGADDLGGTMMEENVVSAAGASFQMPIERLERLIRDAGYEPRQRTTGYEILETAEATT